MRRDRAQIAPDRPLSYFITFRCYGTWLPGDDRGWVDRRQTGHDSPTRSGHEQLRSNAQDALADRPFDLDGPKRAVVAQTIRDVCGYRQWTLHAINVRTNHVHLVVTAVQPPEQVMATLKSWATRRLREAGLIDTSTRPSSRHGSTRYLWTADDVDLAHSYVIDGQGADLH
jgi:REP element-mobilizing transposase RayT